MTEADPMLQDLWSQTSAPAPDPRFVLEVMARVERRRFWLGVLALVPLTMAVAAAAWALAPLLVDAWREMAAGFPPATLAAVAATLTAAAIFLWRRPSEA